MKSYNRYSDINKFVTDPNELKIVDNSYVYISREEDYGIALDLDERVSEFEMLKSQIVFVAEHICELDNMAQRFIYMRHPEEKEFMDTLEIVYIDDPNIVTLEYWGYHVNTQYLVEFKYEDNRFKLKSFGMVNDIPDNWEKNDK